jgi:RNA-directed DNA polymerase
MKNDKQDGWYSRRSFPHFDLPLKFEDAHKLVSDPSRVVSHSFWPFLGYTDVKRRFQPEKPQKYKNKERKIRYCSHHDGYIHSYYARILTDAYEEYLNDKPWKNCVIGYRAGFGSNIHMAKNAFSEKKTEFVHRNSNLYFRFFWIN